MSKPCRFCGSTNIAAHRLRKSDYTCRACERERLIVLRYRTLTDELEGRLDASVISNGRLRLELYDLRRELNRLKTGRDYGLPDHSIARAPLDSRANPTNCTHGFAMSHRCERCGVVEGA